MHGMEQERSHCLPSHPTKLHFNSNSRTISNLIKRISSMGRRRINLPRPTADNTRHPKAHRVPAGATVAPETGETTKINSGEGGEQGVAQGKGGEVREMGGEAEWQEITPTGRLLWLTGRKAIKWLRTEAWRRCELKTEKGRRI
jgi:hypothetical protein